MWLIVSLSFNKHQRKLYPQQSKEQEAGFKPTPEGSYFNALATINETFKFVEDAIAASGANNSDGKIFKIGINCEGESYFNKDPKDANKYEVEGQKNQADQDQLTDYYLRVCNEHPLVALIEDPFANHDSKGYQKMLIKFKNSAPHVKIGCRAMFNDGSMVKIAQFTEFGLKNDATNPYLQVEDEEANKDKFTPDFIHLNKVHIKTIQDIMNYKSHIDQQPQQRQFQFILDDGKIDSMQSGMVDLAVGLGFQYLNIQGFNKPEKLAKVLRLAEIYQ